jgi:hypothetical protein
VASRRPPLPKYRRPQAAGTPLNPVAKSATKKTSKVRKTSRGK